MGRLDSEECALAILAVDFEPLCQMTNKDGTSPLFDAVTRGLERIALEILTSNCSYSIAGDRDGANLLHMIPCCSENVGRLLLEKHGDLLDSRTNSGATVLHYWAEQGHVWPLELLLERKFLALRTKVFYHLTNSTDRDACNPLHIAAKYGKTEFVRVILREHRQVIEDQEVILENSDHTPLVMKNCDGNTPLHLAIIHRREELAIYMLSFDPKSYQTCNDLGESPLFKAVIKGTDRVVEEMLISQYSRFDLLRCNEGQTVLHALSYSPGGEKIEKLLMTKFWWLLNLRDTEGRTAYEVANEEARRRGKLSLVRLLEDPSSVPREPLDWITACQRGDVLSFRTFIEQCHDFQQLCLEKEDTPLHHIKLQNYKDYKDFLKIPLMAELKNRPDSEGATPLHRAIERKDLNLARALLTENDVDRTIKDKNGFTAMDLLAKNCREIMGWEEMCNQIGINPYLKPTYIQPHKTDLGEMRGTLSIVAALLATITFAAGFTLPGGVNSDTGQAVLAKKAAFTVFLLADGYAMCTAMLVLFCLIWSMVSHPDMSLFLIDRSVVILMQSLYGTLVAFMTGVYTVVSHKSLWPPIVVIVMCSLIALTANKTVLFMVLSKFVPAASREHKDRFSQLELGRALTIGRSPSQKGE